MMFDSGNVAGTYIETRKKKYYLKLNVCYNIFNLHEHLVNQITYVVLPYRFVWMQYQ